MDIGLKSQEGIIKKMTLCEDTPNKGHLFVDFTLPEHPVFRGIATAYQLVPLGGICHLDQNKILQNQKIDIPQSYTEKIKDGVSDSWVSFPNICFSCIKWSQCYAMRTSKEAQHLKCLAINTLADELGSVSS